MAGSSKTPKSRPRSKEVGVSKSPAEFFAENQSIAGFDNPGKSLYTTIRELVENALDACESGDTLPDISIKVEEMSQPQFNTLRMEVQNKASSKENDFGPIFHGMELFEKGKELMMEQKKKKMEEEDKKKKKMEEEEMKNKVDDVTSDFTPITTPSKAATTPSKTNNSKTKKGKKGSTVAESRYFRVTVCDNGCGMAHDAIPQLLGRVLSSSKYGVRQTRGKFGLGAKMALIWSKKSTGVPIQVKSTLDGDGDTNVPRSVCVLDIDIYKNQPRVLLHTQYHPQPSNPHKHKNVGTEIVVVIGGNWTTYKSRIVQYLHQLAIITPYAKFELKYYNHASTSTSTRDMTIRYDRRSEQMPPPAQEVKHHPTSVNNLLVEHLIHRTSANTLAQFLCRELSGVTLSLARKVIALLESVKLYEDTPPSKISDGQITRLVQILQTHSHIFKSPDSSCLSPLGEYNLNLGIRKVIQPEIVATARDKPGAVDGHPFLVEAAVSIGGKDAKEGITVTRFANRIPLLFEAGADVVTRVTHSKIKWSSYKIDYKRDRIGVFVSVVSTKIPFKGTGKEYIGDDILPIQQSVKRALQACCQQLRVHLVKRSALRDLKERRSRLLKYVPDVSRAVYGLLDSMKTRKLEQQSENDEDDRNPKRRKLLQPQALIKGQPPVIINEVSKQDIIDKLITKEITEKAIKEHLLMTIETQSMALDSAAAGGNNNNTNANSNNGGGGGGGANGGKKSKAGNVIDHDSQPLFLIPVMDDLLDENKVVHHPLFCFRPLKNVMI